MALTLPQDTIEYLQGVNTDLGWAIVKLANGVQGSAPGTPAASTGPPDVDLVPIAPHQFLIVVRTHEVVRDSAGTHEEGMHVLDTSTPLAVLVAQLNTVAAFATLAVADHRGLFSMGVLLGIAILFVLIVSLVVLPSFMIAIGVGARAAPSPAPGSPA